MVTGKFDVRKVATGLPDKPDGPEAFDESGILGDTNDATAIVEQLEE